MEAMLNLVLDVCDNLYAATSCTNHCYFFALERVAFFVGGRM